MASSTKNVKLGVCKVYYDGVDLGLTKGGVEVTVKTDTHKVNVDQLGKTTVNEYVMGRDVSAKVPLAETTLENMVAIMPGATLTVAGGTVATGTITAPATAPTTGQTLHVNGTTFTFKSALTGAINEIQIPSTYTAAAQATNIAAALNGSTDPAASAASYTSTGSTVLVVYGNQLIYGSGGMKGAEGNSFTLAAGTSNCTLSGATLTGGVDPTSKRVDVTTGIGTDLLAISKELRLHPTNKAAADFSEDFVIPLAATDGALKFAYKLEEERIYDVEFSGYPDPTTNKLFYFGQ